MRITAKVNVAPVKSYFNDLAASLHRTLPETIRMEAAAVVRRAMQMVAYSKVSEVRERALRKGVASFRIGAGFGGTTNVGKRSSEKGRQWLLGRRAEGNEVRFGLWTVNQPSPGLRILSGLGRNFTAPACW